MPVCSFCARLNQPCVWDTERDRNFFRRDSFFNNPDSALAARVALLESKLSLLGGASTSNSATSAADDNTGLSVSSDYTPRLAGPDLDASTPFSVLPPKPTLAALVDIYFTYCHNQPYAYFHEATFRQRFEQDALSASLLFALAATACRFSDDPLYQGSQSLAIACYSNAAWTQVFQKSFSYEDDLDATVVQVLSMLAVIDFTAQHPRHGWVKVALAVRFAQALRLNEEPDSELPIWEREERRRTFWSMYLLDRLISLGPNRPPTFSDSDCTIKLPSSDEAFFDGREASDMPTLQDVLEDSQAGHHPNLDHFALTVLMACTLGQFIRFSLKRSSTEKYPLWDWRSKYHKINGMLLQHESHSVLTYANLEEVLQSQLSIGAPLNQQRDGHLVYSQALYHLNHCLLNHPFVLYHLFQRNTAFVPLSFVREALERSRSHAAYLLDHIRAAQNCGRLAESSFYGYCVIVSGVIFRLYEYHENENIATLAQSRVSMALEYLERQPVRWAFHPIMGLVLREFLPTADMARALIDPINLAQRTPVANADTLWALIDYASLQSEGRRRNLAQRANAAIASHPKVAPPASAVMDSGPSAMMFPSPGGPYSMAHHEMQSYLGDDMGGLWAEVMPNHGLTSGT